MQFVFDGMFAVGAVFVGLWLWSLRGSVSRDKAEAEAGRVAAEREARLQRKGEQLRCLNCDKKFRGPLPDTGCPRCHLASFVTPEVEYQKMKQENTGQENTSQKSIGQDETQRQKRGR